jgi:hypothetical protein
MVPKMIRIIPKGIYLFISFIRLPLYLLIF